MNEQITSAAELDALPLTTIIRDANAMPYVRWPNTPNPEWWRPGSNVPETPRIPALVLYRPDQPQRVQPSREDAARAWHEAGNGAGSWDRCTDRIRERSLFRIDAVLALFAQQPTVAEVKAEAIADTEKVRQAARTLGKIIDDQCRDVLEITGAYDLVGEDGDGDWGAVWDRLRELAEKGKRAASAPSMKAEALRDYAARRFEAYLEHPEIAWPDQPGKLSQQYAKYATELRDEADRIEREARP